MQLMSGWRLYRNIDVLRHKAMGRWKKLTEEAQTETLVRLGLLVNSLHR